jgi:uncharacterized protein (TIGR00661 family)
MLKILYASSRNRNSKIQLSRFMKAMAGTPHAIKIAAYKDYFPKNLHIDWCLDALLNVYRPDLLSLNNDNLNIYFDQIRDFAPDLIISDLEYFTSYLANLLNITLWQCSSSLLDYGLANTYNLGLFKYYAYSLNRDPAHTQRTVNLITNSNLNLIYSHFGDSPRAPFLKENFEWIRPYHQVGRVSVPCQHYVVACFSKPDAHVMTVLKKYPDSVVFMEAGAEKYQNVYVKDIEIEDEYYCNLRNCIHFVCQGQASFLADAFYNGHYSIIYPNYQDPESIISSQLSKKLGLGDIVAHEWSRTYEIPLPTYNSSIKYLHEKIKELE